MNDSKPNKCWRCLGELKLDQEVQIQVREGDDVGFVTVRADVCEQCGERLLHPGMSARLLKGQSILRHEHSSIPAIGRVYNLHVV